MNRIRPGAFSVSLPVTDLERSRRFYEAIGFEVTGGDPDDGWLILVNGTTSIGLFHGMFDRPLLTFNPGIGDDHQPTTDFTDVRDIQAALTDLGATIVAATDADGTGPAHVLVDDPDGHRLMFDQFVDRP